MLRWSDFNVKGAVTSSDWAIVSSSHEDALFSLQRKPVSLRGLRLASAQIVAVRAISSNYSLLNLSLVESIGGPLMLFFILSVHLFEYLLYSCVAINGLFIYDTLCAVDIALIPVEPIDTGLQCLLNDKLLDNDITGAPLLDQVCNQLVLVEVHLSDCMSIAPDHFEYKPWRDNALIARLSLSFVR